MSTLIKDDPAAELRRLASTNFFVDKPEGQSKSAYLHAVAVKQARRFGIDDYLANHYVRIAAYARKVGA